MFLSYYSHIMPLSRHSVVTSYISVTSLSNVFFKFLLVDKLRLRVVVASNVQLGASSNYSIRLKKCLLEFFVKLREPVWTKQLFDNKFKPFLLMSLEFKCSLYGNRVEEKLNKLVFFFELYVCGMGDNVVSCVFCWMWPIMILDLCIQKSRVLTWYLYWLLATPKDLVVFFVASFNCWAVLLHECNDLLNLIFMFIAGNILYVETPSGWHVRPIDFEYSSYNYRYINKQIH